MGDIASLLQYTLRAVSVEFTLYGFTFSLWQVLAFATVASIIGKILGEVFFGD